MSRLPPPATMSSKLLCWRKTNCRDIGPWLLIQSPNKPGSHSVVGVGNYECQWPHCLWPEWTKKTDWKVLSEWNWWMSLNGIDALSWSAMAASSTATLNARKRKIGIFLQSYDEGSLWTVAKSGGTSSKMQLHFLSQLVLWMDGGTNGSRYQTIPPQCKPSWATNGGDQCLTIILQAKQDEKILRYDIISLYSSVHKDDVYSLGHPEIITSNFKDIRQYFGFVYGKVSCLDQCLFPVLPSHTNGKLIFALCGLCAENNVQTLCIHLWRREMYGGRLANP